MEINNVLRIAIEASGLDKLTVIKAMFGDIMGLPGKEAPSIFKGQQVVDKFNQSLLNQADALRKIGNAQKSYADFQKLATNAQEQLMQQQHRVSVETLNTNRAIKAQYDEINRLNTAIERGNRLRSSSMGVSQAVVNQNNIDASKHTINAARLESERQEIVKNFEEKRAKAKIPQPAVFTTRTPTGEYAITDSEIQNYIAATGRVRTPELVTKQKQIEVSKKMVQNIMNQGALIGTGLPSEIENYVRQFVGQGQGTERAIRGVLRKVYQDYRLQQKAVGSTAYYEPETMDIISKQFLGRQGVGNLRALVSQNVYEQKRDMVLLQNNALRIKQESLAHESVQTQEQQKQIQDINNRTREQMRPFIGARETNIRNIENVRFNEERENRVNEIRRNAERGREEYNRRLSEPFTTSKDLVYGVESQRQLEFIRRQRTDVRSPLEHILMTDYSGREHIDEARFDRDEKVRRIRETAAENRRIYASGRRDRETNRIIGEKDDRIRQEKTRMDNIRSGKVSYDALGPEDRKEFRRGQTKEWSSEMGWMIKRHLEWVATGAVLYGVADAFKKAFEEEAKFEKGLARVTSITTHGKDQMQMLRKEILNMDKSIFSASETSQTMYHIVSTGLGQMKGGYLDVAASVKNADNANKLATLGMYDSSEAAVHLAVIMKQFNMKGDESQRVMDGLAYAAAKSATEIPKLGEAMKYAGVVANQAGLSFEDTLGFMMKLADAGIRGSDMGERLRGVLKKLSAPSNDAQKAFRDMHIEMTNTDGSAKTLYEKLDLLRKGISELPSGKAQQFMSKIFEQRNIAAGQILMRYTKEDLQNAISQKNTLGEGQRQFEVMTNNIVDQYKMMKNELGKFGIDIAEPLVRDMSKIVKVLTDVASGFKNISMKTPGLGGIASGGVEALSGIAGTIIAMKMGGWGFEKVFGVGTNIGDFLKSKKGLYIPQTTAFGPQVPSASGFPLMLGPGGEIQRRPGTSKIMRPGGIQSALGMGALGAIGGGLYTGDTAGTAIGGVGMGAMAAFGAPMWATIAIPTLAVMSYKYWKDTVQAQEDQLKYQIALKDAAKHALDAAKGYVSETMINDLRKSIGDVGVNKFLLRIPGIVSKSILDLSGGGDIDASEISKKIFDPGLKKSIITDIIKDKISKRRQKLSEIEVGLENDYSGFDKMPGGNKWTQSIINPMNWSYYSGRSASSDVEDRKKLLEKIKQQVDFLSPRKQKEVENLTMKAFGEISKLSGDKQKDALKKWTNDISKLYPELSGYATTLLQSIIDTAEKLKADREDAILKLDSIARDAEIYLTLMSSGNMNKEKIILTRNRQKEALKKKLETSSEMERGFSIALFNLDTFRKQEGYDKLESKAQNVLSGFKLIDELNINKESGSINLTTDVKSQYKTMSKKYNKNLVLMHKYYSETVKQINLATDEIKNLQKGMTNEEIQDLMYIDTKKGGLTEKETMIQTLRKSVKDNTNKLKDISSRVSGFVLESFNDMLVSINTDVTNSVNKANSELYGLMPSLKNNIAQIQQNTAISVKNLEQEKQVVLDEVKKRQDRLNSIRKDPSKKKEVEFLEAGINSANKILDLIADAIDKIQFSDKIRTILATEADVRAINEMTYRVYVTKLRRQGRGPEAEYAGSISGLNEQYKQSMQSAILEQNPEKQRLLTEEYYANVTELQNTYKKRTLDDATQLKELQIRNEVEVYNLRGQHVDAEYKNKVIQNQKAFDEEMFNYKDNEAKKAETEKFYKNLGKQDYRRYLVDKHIEEATYGSQFASQKLISQGKTIRAEHLLSVQQLRNERDKDLVVLDEKSELYLKRKKYWYDKEYELTKDNTDKLDAIRNQIIVSNATIKMRLGGASLFAEHYARMQDITVREKEAVKQAGPGWAPKARETARLEEIEENKRFANEYSRVYRELYISIMKSRFLLTRQEISAEYNVQYQSLVDERRMRLDMYRGETEADVSMRYQIEEDFSKKVYILWKSVYARMFEDRSRTMKEGIDIFSSMMQSYAQRTGQSKRGEVFAGEMNISQRRYDIANDPSIRQEMKPYLYAQLKMDEKDIEFKKRALGMGSEQHGRLLNNLRILEAKKIKTTKDQEQIRYTRGELAKYTSSGGQVLSTEERSYVDKGILFLDYNKKKILSLQKNIDELTEEAGGIYRKSGQEGEPDLNKSYPRKQYDKMLNRIQELKRERDRISGEGSDAARVINRFAELGPKADDKTRQRISEAMAKGAMREQQITVETLKAIINTTKNVEINAPNVTFSRPLSLYGKTEIDLKGSTTITPNLPEGKPEETTYNKRPINITILLDGKEIGKYVIEGSMEHPLKNDKANNRVRVTTYRD